MFTTAIDKVGRYTRPIHTLTRIYGNNHLIPGAATIFFVNEEGYAITCKHVVEMLIASDSINANYHYFRQERNNLKKDDSSHIALQNLEQKFNIVFGSAIQLKTNFVDCVDRISGFTWHLHPDYDLAIVKFNDFGKIFYSDCAVFLKDSNNIMQGKFLCRLGFPFAEFSNYQLNTATDDIEWTNTGNQVSPRFPIEGMITRFLHDPHGLYGIEMSTPGLRGQSGGPLFDSNGIVYGMQFSTKHLHLGFDLIDKEIMVNTSVQKVSDYSFIHLGQCIHVNVIKAFLRQHQVRFYEGNG